MKINSSRSFVYDDPVYITSAKVLGPADIVFTSRNESILRKVILQTLFDQCEEVLIDPLTLLD